jgi:uncharacterized protein (TIGR03437 family)
MFSFPLRSPSSLTVCLAAAAMLAPSRPLAAQTSQFIAGVESAIDTLTGSLPTGNNAPLVFGGQNMFSYGLGVAHWNPQLEIDYLDGLKAAGVQRVDFNPAVTTINDPAALANLDVMVRHARQLGMLLSINPEYIVGEFNVTQFSDFTTMAIETYPALVARYQPDNFVIVHEPSTQTARMGITATPAQWVTFIEAVEPLVKAASPHTRVGAGDCSHCNENDYFSAFVLIPTCTSSNLASGCLDFMTMDLYSDATADFLEDEGWAQAAHANNKTVYMEETFAPHDLGQVPPGGVQSNPDGAEAYSLVGTCDTVFEGMDQAWLLGIAQFDLAYGMEGMTTFTTQTFFLYTNGPVPYDESTNGNYLMDLAATISPAKGGAQLTATGTAYAAEVQQYGASMATSISNASYATLPTVFNPSCGVPGNPCNPDSTVAPDMIVSAFGADLANQSIDQSDFPTDLGGTTATLVDSANTSFAVQIYSVTPNQMNYLVPSKAAYGPATLTVTSGDGAVTNGVVLVAPVAPGLYTYFATGQGTAAAIAICAGTCSEAGWQANPQVKGQFFQNTFVSGCAKEPCTAPLGWGANDTLVIELYGTGIRHLAALSDVTANLTVGTGSSAKVTNVPVQFAGAQGTDLGLDQVNVLIPQSLNGAGQVTLSLATKYTDAITGIKYQTASNPVNLDLK